MKVGVVALALVGAVVGSAAPAPARTLVGLVQQCAPRVAPRSALAIISVESGGRWWAVGDNDVPTPPLRSPAEALAYARRRVAQGGSIDIGLAQLNSAHLASMRLTVDEAFEPCTNIAMGMSVLQAAWRDSARRWGPTRYALFKAFEAYNGGPGAWDSQSAKLRKRVEGYASAVWAQAQSMPLIAPRATRRHPAAATARPFAVSAAGARGGPVDACTSCSREVRSAKP